MTELIFLIRVTSTCPSNANICTLNASTLSYDSLLYFDNVQDTLVNPIDDRMIFLVRSICFHLVLIYFLCIIAHYQVISLLMNLLLSVAHYLRDLMM